MQYCLWFPTEHIHEPNYRFNALLQLETKCTLMQSFLTTSLGYTLMCLSLALTLSVCVCVLSPYLMQPLYLNPLFKLNAIHDNAHFWSAIVFVWTDEQELAKAWRFLIGINCFIRCHFFARCKIQMDSLVFFKLKHLTFCINTPTQKHTHIFHGFRVCFLFASHRNRQFDVFPRKLDLNSELSDTELAPLSQDHNIHINLSSSSHKMWLNLSLMHLCSVKPFSQIKRVLWISVV